MKPSHRQREVGLSPAECNSASADGEQNMKKVKELIQDIKGIGGLEDCGIGGLDCGIEITQSKILQSSNGKGGAA